MKKLNDIKNKIGLRIKLLAEKKLKKEISRRSFLKGFALLTALTAIGKPQKSEAFSLDEYFQKHYKELTPEDKERIFNRIEAETKQKHGVEIKLKDPPPLPGVKFAFAISLSKCNGNRKCVEACQKENNADRSFSYIKVLEMDRGSFNFEKSDRYYEGIVPKKDKFYLPVQCNQCDNPPCTKACPVEATWKEKDGIVVVDYNWCIGCRYCQAACPYEARYFNFNTPQVPKDEINLDQSYLSNRIRPRGVVEKCTFCLHRTRKGKYPACLEACPTGARKFGNILDPESEVSFIIKNKNVFVLKEELNTIPQVFYYFD